MAEEKSEIIFDQGYDQQELDGVVSLNYKDVDAFYHNTDITKADLKRVSKYQHEYSRAATTAAVAEAEKVLLKKPKVDRVVVTFPYGTTVRGNITVGVDREKVFYNALVKDEKGNPQEIKAPKITAVITDPNTSLKGKFLRDLKESLAEALQK